MKTMQKALILLSACLYLSCTKSEQDNQPTEPMEMTFSTDLTVTTVPVKADLYNNDNIISKDNKGNFSVIAYVSGSTTKHFEKTERVFYMYYQEDPSESRWRFYDSSTNSFYERYWPVERSLDFFAYMPYDLADSHVTVDINNQTFTCELPTDKSGQDSTHEFVYAFATGQKSSSNKGKVNLEFTHPFSAINFTLGQAQGNTKIHSVGLTGIYNTGTFSVTSGSWSHPTDSTDMNISVEKTTGASGSEGIQTNSHIGGPYLVIPQTTDNICLTVSYTWNGKKTDASVPLETGNWLAGHMYTYKLQLGDNQADIISNVSVVPWTEINYKNNIDIE